MTPNASPQIRSSCPIDRVETTNNTLSDRGGLILFNRYLFQIGILAILGNAFDYLRKNQKGLPIWKLFQQFICFFFEGTNPHLTHFDELKRDGGYAATVEADPDELASSHQMKRFIKSFNLNCWKVFRRILCQLFIWRLKLDQPDVIELYLDTVVLDNDQAQKRHGVKPTYKKVKGFQPIQINWNGFTVDAHFRNGKKHSNHQHQALKMVIELAAHIRQAYRPDVTIIVRMDAGFFDEDNFAELNRHNIGFIATGKKLQFVKDHLETGADQPWAEYHNDRHFWKYLEFGYRCARWEQFWRAFYTVPISDENGQLLLEFDRSEQVILTNLGVNPNVLAHLSAKDQKQWIDPVTIIKSRHQCGADELPHRALKDFGTEKLPFKRFIPNSVFYYIMLITFFLFESFKRDILKDDVPGVSAGSYATTVRRIVVDIAAKIVKKSHRFVLKVTRAVMERLRFQTLWERCQNPTPIIS